MVTFFSEIKFSATFFIVFFVLQISAGLTIFCGGRALRMRLQSRKHFCRNVLKKILVKFLVKRCDIWAHDQQSVKEKYVDNSCIL